MNRKEALAIYSSGEERTVKKLLKQAESLKEAKQKLRVLIKEVSKRGSGFCWECFEKQRRIDRLEEEVKRLKAQLRYRENTEKEGYFGSSTPSSKLVFKSNSLKDNQEKRGGAQKGHPGYGRRTLREEEADGVEDVLVEDECPYCGGVLEEKGVKRRTVIEMKPVITEKLLYRLHHKYCPRCKRKFYAKAPSVLPKHLYGNQLLAQSATMHYVHGIPMGRVAHLTGVDSDHLFGTFHRLSDVFSPALEKLTEVYRQAPVKHADETGWRTDGHSGYAWLFCTPEVSIFKFRNTRSSSVPKEVFSHDGLPGVLVVDRYNGYNQVPCKIQYCYAHLCREVTDLKVEFPDEPEVANFAEVFAPLLAKAMELRTQKIGDKEFYIKARKLREKITAAVERPAKHLGIRRIQDIFQENALRMYHWESDRRVPADNNFCERELRPIVIARKVSFGSQSQRGARTREILMTVLNTLQKNTTNVVSDFKAVLDKLATDPTLDPYPLLFPYFDSS